MGDVLSGQHERVWREILDCCAGGVLNSINCGTEKRRTALLAIGAERDALRAELAAHHEEENIRLTVSNAHLDELHIKRDALRAENDVLRQLLRRAGACLKYRKVHDDERLIPAIDEALGVKEELHG